MCGAAGDVCFGPIADIGTNLHCRLFDQFVGTGLKRWRHCEAKGLRGLEINDELELGRYLDRQLARVRATENAIDI